MASPRRCWRQTLLTFAHVGLSANRRLTSSCPRAELPGTGRVTITNCLVSVRPARTVSAFPERHTETSQQA